MLAAETNHHRHKLSPYDGLEFDGAVLATYLRGEKIYDRGEFSGKPTGQLLLREPPKKEPSIWDDFEDNL